MSLGKLLATGRSLVGGAPDAGRYDISARNRLPKFGSVKNPFAPSATAEAQVASATTGEAEQPALDGAVKTSVQHGKTQRIPELADQTVRQARDHAAIAAPTLGAAGPNRLKAGLQAGAGTAMGWMKSFWQLARAGVFGAASRFKWGSSLQVCGSLATGLWGLIRRTAPLGRAAWAKVYSLFGKLTGLFRKPEPKSVIPRFGKPAVQAELSLDRVKVIRNSLEDSDLEIVTAETQTSTVVAPKTPVASPKRGPVPPALKKMTERLLGAQTLD